MQKSKFFGLFAAAVFSITAIVCALILVKPSILLRNSGGVSVKGYASKLVTSDAASWSAVVSAKDADRAKAFNLAGADLSKVLSVMESCGAKRQSVIVDTPNVSEIFGINEKGSRTNTVEYYSVGYCVSYSTGDIALISKIAKAVSELCGQGVNVSVGSPNYYYSALEDLKIELLATAMKNAKDRALAMGKMGNARLGKVVSASQGVFQITPPLSSATSDYGMYDTSSVEKEVKCVVTVKFDVQ